MKQMNFNQVLEEVKKDYTRIEEKIKNIEGYTHIAELYKLVPSEFRNLITVKDNCLYFGIDNLGVIDEIQSINKQYSIGSSFSEHTIIIENINCDYTYNGNYDNMLYAPIIISFEYGKNRETGNYEYINYKVRIDQI